MTHWVLKCGLSGFFERAADRFSADRIGMAEPDEAVGQKLQRPARPPDRRGRAGQLDQARFTGSIQEPLVRPVRPAAREGRLEALLAEAGPHPSYRRGRTVQRLGDPPVGPGRPASVGLQENPGTEKLAGLRGPTAEHPREPRALLVGQSDGIGLRLHRKRNRGRRQKQPPNIRPKSSLSSHLCRTTNGFTHRP
jgi:hypothetical protein